jgi:hypothetical protein
MKLESTNKNPNVPPTVAADAKPVQAPAKSDFVAESKNDEFMLFRDDAGKDWAFPRCHLVSSKMKGKVICELNFRTHLVTFGGNDCTETFPSLRDGSVCAVVAGKGTYGIDHIRTVDRLHVEVMRDELKGAAK